MINLRVSEAQLVLFINALIREQQDAKPEHSKECTDLSMICEEALKMHRKYKNGTFS